MAIRLFDWKESDIWLMSLIKIVVSSLMSVDARVPLLGAMHLFAPTNDTKFL